MNTVAHNSVAQVKESFDQDIKSLREKLTPENYSRLRQKYLGKKGDISSLMRSMGSIPPEERPRYGKAINALREYADAALQDLEKALRDEQLKVSLQSKLDPTLPGKKIPAGTLHPLTQVREDIIDFFHSLGFQIARGREVETDWYNFEALNIPPEHPARDMQDTFYVDDGVVLRTQTSNLQIHAMENQKPPIRLIAPGHVYRADSDASHAPMFQQVEGLVVDKDISFAHLKGLLYLWVKHMFGPEVELRFRPSFFPFTEPSAEMDISSPFSKTGWMEIGGCGSVDPNVFEKVGIDPEKYTGFAFGFGIDRIAMIQYNIPEIGLLTQSDNRFLRQF